MRTEFQRRCDAAWRADYAGGRRQEMRFSRRVMRSADDLVDGAPTRLYVIHHPDGDAIKIGVSRDIKARLATLQTASPSRLELVADIPATEALERLIHTHLRAERLTGEWFRCTDRALIVCELLMTVGDTDRDLTRIGDVFDLEMTVIWLREAAEAATTTRRRVA